MENTVLCETASRPIFPVTWKLRDNVGKRKQTEARENIDAVDVPNGAGEEDRILRDDGEPGAKLF